MNTLTITEHAAVRMSQRGIMPKDAELIILIGTEIDDGYLVREKGLQGSRARPKAAFAKLPPSGRQAPRCEERPNSNGLSPAKDT
jgi:hypothetical protein